MKEFLLFFLGPVCLTAAVFFIIFLIGKLTSSKKQNEGNTAEDNVISVENIPVASHENTVQQTAECVNTEIVEETEKQIAKFADSSDDDKRITCSIKGIGSGFVIVILVGFCVYGLYMAFGRPYIKSNEAYLELLSKDRDRLLEYEPMGEIKASSGRYFNLYYKEDAYYIFDKYQFRSYKNDDREQSLVEYVDALNPYNVKKINNTNVVNYNVEHLERYIRLTPCTYYDDRGNYYNYCFFNGEDRVYFNI